MKDTWKNHVLNFETMVSTDVTLASKLTDALPEVSLQGILHSRLGFGDRTYRKLLEHLYLNAPANIHDINHNKK